MSLVKYELHRFLDLVLWSVLRRILDASRVVKVTYKTEVIKAADFSQLL